MKNSVKLKSKKGFPISRVLFYILTIGFAFITLLPFLWSFYGSFRPAGDVYKFTINFSNLSIKNYVAMAQAFPISQWYMNSIIVAISVTVGTVLMNSMVGYALARIDFPGKVVLYTVILGTMMIPSQITMIPIFMLLSKLNLVNTLVGLVIPFLFSAFSAFLMRQFYISMPAHVEEAAEIDGLTRLGIFFKLALPLARAPIVTLIILNFVGNWNSFLWPSLLASKREIYTLPVGLSTLTNQYYSFPDQIMTGTMYLTIPMIILFIVFQKYFIAGLASTGNKE